MALFLHCSRRGRNENMTYSVRRRCEPVMPKSHCKHPLQQFWSIHQLFCRAHVVNSQQRTPCHDSLATPFHGPPRIPNNTFCLHANVPRSHTRIALHHSAQRPSHLGTSQAGNSSCSCRVTSSTPEVLLSLVRLSPAKYGWNEMLI